MREPGYSTTPATATRRSCRLLVGGRVQGVGFRPFVYRLAARHRLLGQVQNCLGQVEIVVSGAPGDIQAFQRELIEQAPPLALPHIESVTQMIEPTSQTSDSTRFRIATSRVDAEARVFVPPDFFMCDDCGDELKDPQDRRCRYPFINCTQCGPRYTLIQELPYDRINTSMSGFPLCDACRSEYTDPLDRRFHAEPVACPACGPQLTFTEPATQSSHSKEAALRATIEALHAGRIVAVKGIGGYHLMCDARREQPVAELRRRKQRPHKPLAVMVPMSGPDGLDDVRAIAVLSDEESALLIDPVRPIVLCRKRSGAGVAGGIAPGLGEIGVFLPYSPLHQLLLDGFGGPLVATSGNLSGEPVLTSVEDATSRLGHIADAFLHHDRPILRPADDPVFRKTGGRLRPLRVGRGCAPVEMTLPWKQPRPLLAVGGHMKGSITLSWDNRAVVSPHIGEMDSPRSLRVFEQLSDDLQRLYKVRAEAIVYDPHPAYATRHWALRQPGLPGSSVWHHRAHASALAAEHPRPGAWLVFTWDGVGLGEDGTLWGGEALHGRPGQWARVASLRHFRLPGGDRAGRQPWRSAAALSWECEECWRDFPDSQGLAYFGWERRLNCPETSAAGRLFDAAAFFIRGTAETSFEAQGPMLLESLCNGPGATVTLPLVPDRHGIARSDWQPLIEYICNESLPPTHRAETFHTSMAKVLLDQARQVRATHGVDQVGLSGGVFQNRVLCDQAIALLRSDGFEVLLATGLPCNDAALSFGQAAEQAAQSALGGPGDG